MLKEFARWILRDEIDGYKAQAFSNFTQSRERWLYEYKKLLGDIHLCELQLAEMHFKNIDLLEKDKDVSK
jgi:hypothetical protein